MPIGADSDDVVYLIVMIAVAANSSTNLLPRRAVCFSKGIRSIRHIEAFLDLDELVTPLQAKQDMSGVESVLVWGRKSNTATAMAFAKSKHLPIIYLEDGWLRTSSRNAHSRNCYSLLVDHSGVYYDVNTPSDIEKTLNLSDDAFAALVSKKDERYASDCLRQLTSNNISKYNFASSTAASSKAASSKAASCNSNKPQVIVVDQTRDDASVVNGAMDAARFAHMLDSACIENPHCEIVVRTHPDVVSGRREGYLIGLAKQKGLTVSAGSTNAIQVVKQASKVYVGTSQLGYEALLCGVPVTVFGKPFYAGWGLTDDRQPIAHRVQRRSIEQLFYVSHVMLARYVNPATGESWKLHECLEHIQLQQHYFQLNAQRFHCRGITPWKRRYIKQFLQSPDGEVSFGKSPNPNSDCSVTWSYRAFKEQDSQPIKNKLVRLEDGFIRSTGLGSDFNAPASLVVDSRGLYFDPSTPSDLEHLLNNHDCSIAEISRIVKLKKLILSAGLSKYNVGDRVSIAPKSDKHTVLVVGQVEDDQSIIKGCERVNTNSALLEKVRSDRPEAWIIYKPHPDVVSGNRKGFVPASVLAKCANSIELDVSIVDCIEQCDELHTMTSLAGFEALMRGKDVVTYGAPFYSGWGLTKDHQPVARRTRRRTLDELMYLTLIEYPRYLDLVSGEFIKPEDLVKSIIKQKTMNSKTRRGKWSNRQLVKVVNVLRGLRYAP